MILLKTRLPVISRGRFFFLQSRIAIPRYFSQLYGAYFKYIVHVHVHTRTVLAQVGLSPSCTTVSVHTETESRANVL